MSEEKKGLLARTPLQSKKFLAAMIWNLLWLALIGYGINQQIGTSTLNAMVYSSGLVQCLYLGGQSAVDAFVRKSFSIKKQEDTVVSRPK